MEKNELTILPIINTIMNAMGLPRFFCTAILEAEYAQKIELVKYEATKNKELPLLINRLITKNDTARTIRMIDILSKNFKFIT